MQTKLDGSKIMQNIGFEKYELLRFVILLQKIIIYELKFSLKKILKN